MIPTNIAGYNADLTIIPPGQAAGLIEPSATTLEQLLRSTETFADARPGLMVPRSELKDRSQALVAQYRDDVTKIYSQGQISSCVGFAATQMLEVTLRRRYGKRHWVSLSGMSVYKRIGRSAGSGAMVADGMDAVIEGVLPTDTPENQARYPHTHPLRNFNQQLPPNWLSTGRLFRGQRFVVARGFDMITSALVNGYCGIVGRDGHCVPYVYLDITQRDEFVATYANSWDANWGDSGFGYDGERILRDITCWILLDVVTRPDLDIPDLGLSTSPLGMGMN